MVLKRRDTPDKETVECREDELAELVEDRLGRISSHLKEKAWNMLQENMKETDSPLEARDIIQEDGGVVSFLWCGDEACGKELEEQVHVDILGIQEDADGTCVNCKQKARYRALLARTY